MNTSLRVERRHRGWEDHHRYRWRPWPALRRLARVRWPARGRSRTACRRDGRENLRTRWLVVSRWSLAKARLPAALVETAAPAIRRAKLGLVLIFALLLQPCPNRHILEKACQYWLSALQRCGHDHAIGLQSAQFARSEVGDDDHFAADQRFGRVGFGDSGQDLPHFGADVDLKPQELVGLGHALGDLHHADPQLDLREVVDGDLLADSGRRTYRRTRLRRSHRHLSHQIYFRRGLVLRHWNSLLLFHLLHPFNGALVGAWKNRVDVAKLRARRQLSPGQFTQIELLYVTESKLCPDLRGSIWNNGIGQHRRNA